MGFNIYLRSNEGLVAIRGNYRAQSRISIFHIIRFPCNGIAHRKQEPISSVRVYR